MRHQFICSESWLGMAKVSVEIFAIRTVRAGGGRDSLGKGSGSFLICCRMF